MSVSEKVQELMREAMRARNSELLSALRMIRAGLLEASKEGAGPLTEEREMQVLRRLHKRALDSAESYRQAGRTDLAEIELYEASVVASFLPRTADDEQVRRWVIQAIQSTGATSPRQLGLVMGALMKAHKAELDARRARSIVQEELGKLVQEG